MNEFTASNGVFIRKYVGLDGHAYLTGARDDEHGRLTHVTSSADGFDALREFFRAEEDERLERWRFPELPWLLVYHWGQPTSAGVVVVDEGSGATSRVIHRNADPENESPDYRAARAYFDAHPEPKPWHRALPGESWVLVYLNEKVPAVASSSESGHIIFTASTNEGGGTEEFFTDSKHITAGRRVYPEPS